MRFEEHPAEQWTPVRYLSHDTTCDFCRFPIAKHSPGRRAGTRGTWCWWNSYRRIYECLGCRTEANRAAMALQAQEDAARLARLRGAA